jgi:hypothetical protein
MLARLLPHPEEWGFESDTSPLLPAPDKGAEIAALPAPEKRRA